jgi:hypothetical protein
MVPTAPIATSPGANQSGDMELERVADLGNASAQPSPEPGEPPTRLLATFALKKSAGFLFCASAASKGGAESTKAEKCD